jgi:hypothetical protein
MAHVHGAGRISAAVTGAPGAAVLASLALAAVLPVSGDLRLLVAMLAVLPAAATASCLALLARSAVRAWVGSALVAAVAAVVLVLT